MKAMNGWRVFFSSFTPKKFCVMLCKKVIENIVDKPVPFLIFGILIQNYIYLALSIGYICIMPKWNLAFGRCNQDLPNTIRNCNLTVDLKSYSAIRF